MYALYNYELTMFDGVGSQDDIDMLGNRRIRTVGELIQNQSVLVYHAWNVLLRKECLSQIQRT